MSARQAKRGTDQPSDAAAQPLGYVEEFEDLRYAMQRDDWIYLADQFRPGGAAYEVFRPDTWIARELLAYIRDVLDGKKTKRFDGKEKSRSPTYKRREQRTIGSFVAGLMNLGLSQQQAIEVAQNHLLRVHRNPRTIKRDYSVYNHLEQEKLRRYFATLETWERLTRHERLSRGWSISEALTHYAHRALDGGTK